MSGVNNGNGKHPTRDSAGDDGKRCMPEPYFAAPSEVEAFYKVRLDRSVHRWMESG